MTGQQTFVGVRNRTDQPQTGMCDGVVYEFEKGEYKVLPAEVGAHLNLRMVVRHRKDEKGAHTPHIEGVRLFEIVPLADALKHAKVTEDPRVVAEREAEEKKVALRKELVGEILADLKEQGWTPPAEKDPLGSKGGKK